MQVRIEDYKLYVKHNIEYFELLNEDHKQKIETRTKEYESHWLAKLLKFKFKDSEEYRWGWHGYDYEVQIWGEELNKVTYAEKITEPGMKTTLHIDNPKAFCNWAAANNIPY